MRRCVGAERRLQRALTDRAHIRQTHAVGGEHAGEGVQEHPVDAERVGHQAGVLACGGAESGERAGRDVMSAPRRDGLDGVGHVVHGDGEEALGDFGGRAAVAGRGVDLVGERRRTRLPTAARSRGRSPPGPNTLGKKRGSSLPSMRLQSVTVSGPPRR